MPSALRVLFVSHSFPPTGRPLSNVGGMQRVATELHDALRAHSGVDFSSVVLRSSWKWTHVKTVPFLAAALVKLRRQIASGQVDAVLFSSMVSASLAVFLRPTLDAYGVRAAAIVHGRDVTLNFRPYQRIVPRIFQALDVVLPVSRATGDACLERGLQSEKLYVVPNGVSLGRFSQAVGHHTDRARLLRRFGVDGVPDEGLLLCSVGRHVRRKGFAWFVESVLPLLPEDVHYWLAGDGPESESIRDAAARRGIEHRVRLLGRVAEADLELIYAGADLFVMPNIPVAGDMEGFGVVMLEAGLSGLPTIASRLEGITDVIREGENGHLLTSGDAWGFSEAIMRYYHDGDRLSEARERAATYVADHFSWHAVADRYVDALRTATAPSISEEALA